MTEPPATARPSPASRAGARRVEIACWLLLGCATMFGFLGRAEISKVHEERVAETAITMAKAGWPWSARSVRVPRATLAEGDEGSHLVAPADGATINVNPWLVPIFERQIRLQKPPLPYWCAAMFDRLLGTGALAARLVPATLGALSGALVYLLARRLGGRRLALATLAIWTSSHFVIDEYRKAMADPYLAFFSLAAIVAWIEASSRRARRGAWIVAFYVALGLGAMAKGPVVFLHAGVAIAAFSFCHRRRPRAAWLAHVGGALLFGAIALPWPIYIVSHVPGAIEIWRFESIGEFADNQRNARPFWFYVPQLLLIAAPWTALAIVGAVTIARRWRRRRHAFAGLWALLIVAVFSLSHMKKNAYLLPLMPAIALLAAGEARRLIALARPRGVRAWTVGHAVLGIAAAALVVFASGRAGASIATTIAIAVVCCGAAAVPLRMSLRDAPTDRWLRAQAVAFALIIAAFVDFPQSERPRKKTAAIDAPIVAPAPM